jgi:hypothetical protein
MPMLEHMEIRDGLCTYRPRGSHSLVKAVELVSQAIATCRSRGVPRLLVNATDLADLPIPSLVDRFLMVEDWAQEAKGLVLVALVVHAEYIHPRKFGVTVALHLGLVCDVFTTEAPALKWLQESQADSFARREGTG